MAFARAFSATVFARPPVSYGLALVLALWSPVASLVLVLLVALFYALPSELLFKRHPDSERGQHHHAR